MLLETAHARAAACVGLAPLLGGAAPAQAEPVQAQPDDTASDTITEMPLETGGTAYVLVSEPESMTATADPAFAGDASVAGVEFHCDNSHSLGLIDEPLSDPDSLYYQLSYTCTGDAFPVRYISPTLYKNGDVVHETEATRGGISGEYKTTWECGRDAECDASYHWWAYVVHVAPAGALWSYASDNCEGVGTPRLVCNNHWYFSIRDGEIVP